MGVVSRVVAVLIGLPPALVLVAVFVLRELEASTLLGIVVPGEIAVLLGGVVAQGGGLPLWAVLAAATCWRGCRRPDRLFDRAPVGAKVAGACSEADPVLVGAGPGAEADRHPGWRDRDQRLGFLPEVSGAQVCTSSSTSISTYRGWKAGPAHHPLGWSLNCG